MKKLIVHIGYPKTATTTIQESIFLNLHKSNVINYLGKTIEKGDKDLIDYARKEYKEYILSDKNIDPKSINIPLKENKINLLSNEEVCNPKTAFMEEVVSYKYGNTDPYDFPEKIKNVFDNADEINIMVTLRKQTSAIYSTYVQYYEQLSTFRKFKTWDKYFNYGINNYDNAFSMYFYNKLLDNYAKYFDKDNIKILLFEDFANQKEVFLSELANILNIDFDILKKNYDESHYRKRKKTKNKYFTKGNNIFGNIINLIRKPKIAKKLYNFYEEKVGENNIVKKIYSMGKTETAIQKITDEQRNTIFNLFEDDNLKLINNYNVDYSKLKEYGYID